MPTGETHIAARDSEGVEIYFHQSTLPTADVTRPRGKELWYNVKHKGEERRRAMPAVMEQIGKMSRVEQIRIARLILEAIENGEVVFGGERPSVNRLNVGLMKAEVDLPSDFDAVFDSLDETISSELVGC